MDYTIIGIDFGTSATVVKVKNYYDGMVDPRDFKSLELNRSGCLPTLIFEDGEGKMYCGHEAVARVEAGEEGALHENFKMDLIGDCEDQAKAEKLVKEFFRYIYSNISDRRGVWNISPRVKTNISYPAKWSEGIRELMKRCAGEADEEFGIGSEIHGVKEPTAAVYASIIANIENLQKKGIVRCNRPINVMMLDMGAGTSDIAIFKFMIDENGKPVENQLMTYPAVDNHYLCGGREIDELLRGHMFDYIKKISGRDDIPRGIKKVIARDVKGWKEKNLSEYLKIGKAVGLPGSVKDTVRDMQEMGTYKNLPFEPIDRRQFELLTRDHWKNLRSLIFDAVSAAKTKLSDFKGAEDVDLLILTGGHSRWYGVREMFEGKDFAALEPLGFSKIASQPDSRILMEQNPQETVAIGLAYKDLPFEIKNTMGNSLWVRYTVDGVQSDVVQIAEHNDVLPFNETIETEIVVKTHWFRLKKIPVTCEFFCGSVVEDAMKRPFAKSIEVPVPDVVLRYLLALLAPLLAIGGDQQYMKITSEIKINEEEEITINVVVNVRGLPDETPDPSKNIPFTVKAG